MWCSAFTAMWRATALNNRKRRHRFVQSSRCFSPRPVKPPVETETIKTYASKSASREAFEKLCTPEKAKARSVCEGPNVMAVWGTPDECIEKIKFYVDAMHPEQLMLNIASGSLAQEKTLKSMRLCAERVLPALRQFWTGKPRLFIYFFPNSFSASFK